MESSDKNQEGKNFTVMKTFTVPFSLGTVKENININTDTSFKLSKHQIINQAFSLHSKGNTLEASKYYQLFINHGYNDYRVFSNYGTILNDQGKSKEAEILLRRAIEVKPDFAEGYFNLGNILQGLGKSEEAISCYKEALNLDKNIDLVKNNLGRLLLKNGNLRDGLSYLREAYGSILFNYKNSSIVIN